MRKNRRNNAKKERTIMIASSVFVLAALTMTGIYMKSNNTQEQDDGYTIDFTALENNVDDKYEEIAQNQPVEESADTKKDSIANGIPDRSPELSGQEDDLDYLPMEAGSALVKIPGLTDGTTEEMPEEMPSADTIAQEPEITPQKPEEGTERNDADATATPEAPTAESGEAAADAETSGEADSAEGSAVAAQPLHFAESEGLLRPVSGEVLSPFSMDSSVYFSTLDQFKYNSAMMIAAELGSAVTACADGQVISIFENEEIGKALTVDLGDGYQITYGQLDEIRVMEGSYVEPGEVIAFIAAPTKYYSVEGSNLYLKLTLNGAPVNPEVLFQP